MQVDGNLLTAAGLLLATLGLLFSAWHPEIETASKVSSGGKFADRGPRIVQVRRALYFRAIPLLIAVTFVVLACGPPAVMVVIHALSDDWGNSYDPVRALFIGVWFLMIGIGVVLFGQIISLRSKWRTLNYPD